MKRKRNEIADAQLLKPMDLKRMAKVPYASVISWLTDGHPRAGLLPSIDLAAEGRRHSFRVRRVDWEAFLARLETPVPRKRSEPMPRPAGETGVKRFVRR